MSNNGSPRFTDFPSLCACSESSLTNLIGSGLNLLCLQIHSKPKCRWTWPEVAILGADQKERGLWGRECLVLINVDSFTCWLPRSLGYCLIAKFCQICVSAGFSQRYCWERRNLIQVSSLNFPSYMLFQSALYFVSRSSLIDRWIA